MSTKRLTERRTSSDLRFILADTEFDEKARQRVRKHSSRLQLTRDPHRRITTLQDQADLGRGGRQHTIPAATKLRTRVPQVSSDEATNKTTLNSISPTTTGPKMPVFNKANYISSLPVSSATRRFSEKYEFAGQLVHPKLEDLQKPPMRNEHILSTLAQSRGELGIGYNRVALGRRCELAETIVLPDFWKGEAVQAEEYAEGMERAEEPQYSALPRHVRHGKAQAAIQNHQSRTIAEFTAGNIQAIQAFSEHSFEVPDDHMSFTDPASSSELEEGEEDSKAAEGDSRQATLRSMHIREHALRRAHEIGLHRAISGVKTEREEYLGIMKMGRK